jgi:hypothetical protein
MNDLELGPNAKHPHVSPLTYREESSKIHHERVSQNKKALFVRFAEHDYAGDCAWETQKWSARSWECWVYAADAALANQNNELCLRFGVIPK